LVTTAKLTPGRSENQETVVSIGKALDFAVAAHGSQLYGNKKPQGFHLVAAMEVLGRFGWWDSRALMAAALHDTVEDTDVTVDQIRGVFGDDVANIVFMCTDPPAEKRRIRKNLLHAQFRRTIDGHYRSGTDVPYWLTASIAVKIADRITNVENCLRESDSRLGMYRKELPPFHEAMDIRMYAPDIHSDMWQHLFSLFGMTRPT
jgi:(p)ppGpp synthase/HD superfamily hydrolase